MPEDRTFIQSNFCSLGPRPQIITGMFISLLRDHYASADNIEHAVFRERLFQQGDATGIAVEDATVWVPNHAGKRPELVVKRNGWEHQKRFTFDGSAGLDDAGNPVYSKLWRGSHTIFCVAKSGGETEILTAETYRFFMHFGPVIRDYFGLLLFELLEVGPVQQIEEATTRYAVPITIGYGWDEAWAVYEHMAQIRDVRLSQVFETYYGSNRPTE